jgi:predicted metal-dependent hydrolase
LQEMNHSSNFWDLVAQFDFGYKQHRKSLKRFQYAID